MTELFNGIIAKLNIIYYITRSSRIEEKVNKIKDDISKIIKEFKYKNEIEYRQAILIYALIKRNKALKKRKCRA